MWTSREERTSSIKHSFVAQRHWWSHIITSLAPWNKISCKYLHKDFSSSPDATRETPLLGLKAHWGCLLKLISGVCSCWTAVRRVNSIRFLCYEMLRHVSLLLCMTDLFLRLLMGTWQQLSRLKCCCWFDKLLEDAANRKINKPLGRRNITS